MTATAEDTTYIPGEDDVQASGGSGAWRFANGKIVRGSETRGTLEVKEPQKIVGKLQRVGIHEGQREDGTKYSQLEADIETATGLIFTKSSLTDDEGRLKPSIATCNFAWGLSQIAKDEIFMITTVLGEPTPKGGKPTYVNFWRVKGTNATQLFRPKRAKDAPRTDLVDQWNELKPAIEKHVAFADRPASRSDDEAGNAMTHLSAFCKECEAKGWPTPEQAPGEWLTMLAGYFKHPVKATVRDYGDDEWGEIRQALADKADAPEALKPAMERLKSNGKAEAKAEEPSGAAKAEEPDPFK